MAFVGWNGYPQLGFSLLCINKNCIENGAIEQWRDLNLDLRFVLPAGYDK